LWIARDAEPADIEASSAQMPANNVGGLDDLMLRRGVGMIGRQDGLVIEDEDVHGGVCSFPCFPRSQTLIGYVWLEILFRVPARSRNGVSRTGVPNQSLGTRGKPRN